MFYHDGRHPLIYMYEPPMRREEYEAAVDELAGTPVEALMFCLGDWIRRVYNAFRISDDLRRWHRAGRIREILLRLRLINATERDRLRFRLNGRDLPGECLRKINQTYRMSAPRYRTGPAYWFVFRLDRALWPRKGRNRLEVTLLGRDPAVTSRLYLRDVELEIRYLMGKNFHRGQDPDLGPSEPSGI